MTLWPLLLPLAAGTGWWLAAKHFNKKPSIKKLSPFSESYLKGLNFLLNEEPDKAVDLFIKMLEVDNDTIETHLALGNLFRRRGEVDRAIRIHQNVIARPNLDKKVRTEAMLGLARDYLVAGVLDRAEKVFCELVAIKAHLETSLRYLLDIYQQQKAWLKAIDTAKKLSAESGTSMHTQLAHYYCELAEIAFEQSEIDEADQHLKQALLIDKNCVRASLLLGNLEYVSGRHKHAIRLYKQVRNQNPDFLSEVIVPLAEVYQAVNEEESLEVYLRKTMQDFPGMPIVLLLSEKIRNWRGDKVAAQFVADYVSKHPSIAGLNRLIDLRLAADPQQQASDLILLRQLTEKILAEQANYQCESCGFSSKTIHWQCPGCKQWGTVKSSYVLEKS